MEKKQENKYLELEGDMIAKRYAARQELKKQGVPIGDVLVYPAGILPRVGEKKLFLGYVPMLIRDGKEIEVALTLPDGTRIGHSGLWAYELMRVYETPEEAMAKWSEGDVFMEKAFLNDIGTPIEWLRVPKDSDVTHNTETV